MYVVLEWNEYHKHNPRARGHICLTEDVALALAVGSDEIIAVETWVEAQRLVDAFGVMARAAWAPNQSPTERAANSATWREAFRVVECARIRARDRKEAR